MKQGCLRDVAVRLACGASVSGRHQARGQMANENRITSGNCPQMPFRERLCFPHMAQCGRNRNLTFLETECGILSLTLYKELNIPKFRFIMAYKTFESHGREPMIFG